MASKLLASLKKFTKPWARIVDVMDVAAMAATTVRKRKLGLISLV